MIRIVFFVLIVHLSLCANAQYELTNFSLADTSTQWLDTRLGIDRTELLTGVYGKMAPLKRNNNPYFNTNNWQPARIFYRGGLYKGVSLLYNVELQEVYIRLLDKGRYLRFPVLLYNENIDWFEIQGHLFVNYREPVSNRPAGIYEVLYQGDQLAFLSFRSKSISVDDRELSYTPDDRFLWCRGGDCEWVGGGSSIKKLYPNDKKALRRLMKEYHIKRFSKAELPSLRALGKFCDTLNSTE